MMRMKMTETNSKQVWCFHSTDLNISFFVENQYSIDVYATKNLGNVQFLTSLDCQIFIFPENLEQKFWVFDFISSTNFKMSYAYLFKYIIIGDTGKNNNFNRLTPLQAWEKKTFLSLLKSFHQSDLLFQALESHVFFSSSRTSDFSQSTTWPSGSSLVPAWSTSTESK